MSQEAKQQVQCFWPEARIEALRSYAADVSENDDAFAKSKRLAWMREFCMEAPSWLDTMQARERLRAKVDAALVDSRAATAQLEAVLQELEQMCAPASHDGQDKWAQAIARVPVQDRPVPAAKPRMKQVDWVPMEAKQPQPVLAEAIAEADPLPPDRPVAMPKLPAPGQPLPAEAQWDKAHKNPPGTTSFRAKLEKLPPDARVRVLGNASALAAAAETKKTQPAPSASRPPPRRRNRSGDGPKRTSKHMEMNALVSKHGAEIALFVAHNIMKDRPTTLGMREVMGRFGGTFADRQAASQRCAEHYGVLKQWYDGKDVLREYAQGRYLEHADGRCSWWRK